MPEESELPLMSPRSIDVSLHRTVGRPDPMIVGRRPLLADGFQERPALRCLLDQAGAAAPGTLVLAGNGGFGNPLGCGSFNASLAGVEFAMWITATDRSRVLSAYVEAYSMVDTDGTRVARATPNSRPTGCSGGWPARPGRASPCSTT
jgi:hypothetical protein